MWLAASNSQPHFWWLCSVCIHIGLDWTVGLDLVRIGGMSLGELNTKCMWLTWITCTFVYPVERIATWTLLSYVIFSVWSMRRGSAFGCSQVGTFSSHIAGRLFRRNSVCSCYWWFLVPVDVWILISAGDVCLVSVLLIELMELYYDSCDQLEW